MKALLQRVTEASVSVNREVIGKCGNGLVILLGVEREDTPEDVTLLCDKIIKLRIFADAQGKMNRSLVDIGGTVLIVSQFTLCADYRHGNRPDYLQAARPSRRYRYTKRLPTQCVPYSGKRRWRPVDLGRICRCSCATTDR